MENICKIKRMRKKIVKLYILRFNKIYQERQMMHSSLGMRKVARLLKKFKIGFFTTSVNNKVHYILGGKKTLSIIKYRNP